jgi:DegV family protein with EDD domain
MAHTYLKGLIIIINHKIVVDSCCDVTPEMKKEHGIVTIPLSLTLGDTSIVDDDTLDLPAFMVNMKNCTGRIGSAAPAPTLYQEAFSEAETSYAVTLSSRLSSSYENAVMGRDLCLQESDRNIHVFDSKSASAGEVLIALKISEMVEAGCERTAIITEVEAFIKRMKTYFVLESLDNLMKNGRMGKVTGKLLSVLSIKPIMGSDGDGNIALYSHGRGQKQIIERLTDAIDKSGKIISEESLVVAHCNNPTFAQTFVDAVKSKFSFKQIIIVPTKGLSSVYANDQGIVLAF